MFVIFSGMSGSGKQTVIDTLMKEMPGSGFVKSATTRPERKGETAHYFFSEKEFKTRLANGEFFESENVHGFLYGILNQDLQKVIDEPGRIFFKDVDVHGTEKLVNYLKDKVEVVTIFLEVPEKMLYERLLKRGESPERAKIRISRGKLEKQYKNSYDYVVENEDLDKTLQTVREIIKKHQK